VRPNVDPADPGFHANPSAYYKALLADAPVQVQMGTLSTVVSRHADALAVLRDPKRFSSVHLSFGDGIRFCIGAAWARIQGRLALNMLLERFPRLRLDDRGWRPVFKGSSMARGLIALPVRLD